MSDQYSCGNRVSAGSYADPRPIAPSPSPVTEVTEEMVNRMAAFLRVRFGNRSQSLDFWIDDARAGLIASLRVR